MRERAVEQSRGGVAQAVEVELVVAVEARRRSSASSATRSSDGARRRTPPRARLRGPTTTASAISEDRDVACVSFAVR